jgi:hypothetical protein
MDCHNGKGPMSGATLRKDREELEEDHRNSGLGDWTGYSLIRSST